MPTATECIYGQSKIGVDRALELKEKAKAEGLELPVFRCIECHEQVKPHRGGGHASAHFEHFKRNSDCSLSHVAPSQDDSAQLLSDYDLNDAKALEGYALDRTITSLKRNAGIVLKCKQRDDYTCQACGFRLKVNAKYVIECHHLKPLAANGERVVSIDELVCLCPTCHRIAHTREKLFDVDELKKLLGSEMQP